MDLLDNLDQALHFVGPDLGPNLFKGYKPLTPGADTGRSRNKDAFFKKKNAASGLQIYGGPGSLSHDFKVWPITFQGSRPSGHILFSCEKISL